MMKITQFIICSLLPLLIIGQHSLSIQLVDSDTRVPIPFANIGIIEQNQGTVSDNNGLFVMPIDDLNSAITISSIGYESKTILASELINISTLTLSPRDYAFDIIEIEANRFETKEIILGAKNKKRGQSIGFGSAQLGAEIGAAIKINNPTFIKTANFVLNHAKGDSLFLRVNIYDFNEGQLGKKMLNTNVFIKEKQRKGIYTIDLSSYNLVIENDVLLTLEWLRDFDESGNKNITFDTKKIKNLKGVYVRYFSNGPLQKLQHMTKRKPCFFFEGKEVR